MKKVMLMCFLLAVAAPVLSKETLSPQQGQCAKLQNRNLKNSVWQNFKRATASKTATAKKS